MAALALGEDRTSAQRRVVVKALRRLHTAVTDVQAGDVWASRPFDPAVPDMVLRLARSIDTGVSPHAWASEAAQILRLLDVPTRPAER